MSSSLNPPTTQLSIKLLLFVVSRSQSDELARQIQAHMDHLRGEYPSHLEVLEIGDRAYLAEHYKLVATPALVKTFPGPPQVLAGEDLTTQLEVWWTRWQRQMALAVQQEEAAADLQVGLSASATELKLSEELFLLRQECNRLQEQIYFKDRMLAMLVHDLRSPLTATSLVVETLQQQESLGPQLTEQLLEQARQQIRKMDGMIADILEAAHGTSASLVIRATEMQVEELMQSVITDFESRFQMKQLIVNTEVPANLPSVHADPDKIRQVLGNLVDNAVKYTPVGGHIWIRALHRTTQKVQITVSDDGPGIPEEDQEKIFSDSVRLVRDQNQEGYGIGLSLCRRIVRAHYGQIWVDSKSGQGSSFHFSLPVYRAY
ncbi:MAG: histidine kinase [Synechococcaceae cyanobacterium SM2_3_1]|nr:histidine kinase [Synechococcaceae cyanobacterium SM2_3_1]